MEELLSLKWNNHCSTFLQVLSTAKDKQKYADVTLACEGIFYSAHKLVLSSCSDYFQQIFDKTDCRNLVILLKDIKSIELEALLDYMYIGEVNVKQAELASLIKAAECLQIKGLAVADDEPVQSTRKLKNITNSPRPKKKRKFDEQYTSNTSPPAKVKSNQSTDTKVNKSDLNVGERLSDSEDIKTVMIKEEPNLYKQEVYSIEDDDYLPDIIDNKAEHDDMTTNPYNFPSTSNASDNDKNVLPEDMYADTPYSESDASDWQDNDSNIHIPSMNYTSADPSSEQPLENQPGLQCPVCYRNFTYTFNMRVHLREAHTDGKRFACPHCPYKAARKTSLRQHVYIKHGKFCDS